MGMGIDKAWHRKMIPSLNNMVSHKALWDIAHSGNGIPLNGNVHNISSIVRLKYIGSLD